MIFRDTKSQDQIAMFRAYEIVAAREHNERNIRRFNDAHREVWEMSHLGQPRLFGHQDPDLRRQLSDAVRRGDRDEAKRLTRVCAAQKRGQ